MENLTMPNPQHKKDCPAKESIISDTLSDCNYKPSAQPEEKRCEFDNCFDKGNGCNPELCKCICHQKPTQEGKLCNFMILTPHYYNGHDGGKWCAETYPCKTHGAWREGKNVMKVSLNPAPD